MPAIQDPTHAAIDHASITPLGSRALAGATRLLRDRSFRIILLLGALIAFSALDLALTLTYLTSVGMFEANPLARTLVNNGSPWALSGWKAGTTLIATWILFSHRKHWQAEAGAWTCAAILAMLTVHWMNYIAHIEQFTPALAHTSDAALPEIQAGAMGVMDSGWVSFSPAD